MSDNALLLEKGGAVAVVTDPSDEAGGILHTNRTN